MTLSVPEHLKDEQRDLEAQIRVAFRDVTREGGISWRESSAIDYNATDAECDAARTEDTDTSWEELVDDPRWGEHNGTFNFLDAFSVPYYMAPAMIRSCRSGGGEFFGYFMVIDSDFKEDLVSRINPVQASVIARFVRFMIAVHAARNDSIGGEDWRHAYKVYWRGFDAGNPAI